MSSTTKEIEAVLRVLTTEDVFFIFLDIVDNSACHLDFGKKVEIAQDKEYFSWLLKLVASIILKDKQVVVLYKLLGHIGLRLRVLDTVVWLPESVTVWEDVETNLQDENGEVNVGNFKVKPLKFLINRRSYFCAIGLNVFRGLSPNLLVFNH